MAIVSAAVEQNGWVLQVNGTWAASTFAGFDLDPNGAPKVVVATTSPGFARSGSTASANAARARTGVVGTKPLRRPFPNHALLDEVDLGGGVRRVRLALSRYVYPGDPVSVAFTAGWRSGQGGGTIAATNNSTHAVRIPSARWACPQYLIENGAFRIDLLVSNIEAEGRSAAAAVRVVGYDGTNTQEWWLTESVSDRYADNLKCWGATINPTALTAGVISLHWEVYPWIGAMRTSGSAHVVDAEAGFSRAAGNALHVCWDPAGTRYGGRHVYIDPVNGTTTPASVTIGATHAAAKAVTRAANNLVAMFALSDQNVAIPAANGYPAIVARTLEGAVLTFAPGVHTVSYGNLALSAKTVEARMIMRGDPDDPNPRANVIFRTDTGSANFRISRVLFRDLTLELGGTWFSLSWRAHFDNVILQGRTGDELATTGMTSSVTAGFFRLSFTNCRFWRYGTSPNGGSSMVVGLIRNLEFTRSLGSPVIISSTRIADATVPIGSSGTVGGGGAVTDTFLWGTRSFYNDNAGLTLAVASGAGTVASPERIIRANVINCIFERPANGAGSLGDPFFNAAGNREVVDSLVEGCTFVGQRLNWGYNDPTDLVTNMASIGNAVRNNFFDRRACKHDIFVQNGNLTAGWANLYGVNEEANVQVDRIDWTATDAFSREFEGMRGVYITGHTNNPDLTGAFIFTDDRSRYSQQGNLLGFGNYLPGSTSLLLGRGLRACIDVDVLGTARSAVFDTGGVEMASQVAIALALDRSRHAVVGRRGAVRWEGRMRTHGAVHGAGGRSPVLSSNPPSIGPAATIEGRVMVVSPEGRSMNVEAD